MTRFAPFFLSASAALTIVPPVSIMSSTSRQTRPSTAPTISLTVTWLATFGSRRLWMIASGAPRLSDHVSATRTRPVSGETTVRMRAVLGAERPLEVLEQHRLGEQVVDGTVEEALDLRGVQVDAHDAVGAGGLAAGRRPAGR